MSEPESHNELQPTPESEPKHEPDPQPEPELEPEPEPEPVAIEQAQSQLEPESGSGSDPPVNDADLKETAINSNDADNNASPQPQLRKDEGSRTFTMRELLHGLKNDSEPEKEDASSPYRFTLSLSISSLPQSLCLILFISFSFVSLRNSRA